MSKVLWLTGLPCSGKTTIGLGVVRRLKDLGQEAMLLDGDIMRSTVISQGLGFSKKDRRTHLLRMADIANLLAQNGVTVVAAFVSPYRDVREEVYNRIHAPLLEVFVDAPVGECRYRDVKGMYGKAIAGDLQDFTGVHAPYHKPENPDIHLFTKKETVEESVERVLYESGVLPSMKPGALFIGRWQPFHNGHDYLVRKALEDDKKVIIGIRRTEPGEKNPLTVAQRKEIIEAIYADDDVEVVVVPDIESVNIGRKVGYDVNRIDAPETVEGISATNIRAMIESGDDSWTAFVPQKGVESIRHAFDA